MNASLDHEVEAADRGQALAEKILEPIMKEVARTSRATRSLVVKGKVQ